MDLRELIRGGGLRLPKLSNLQGHSTLRTKLRSNFNSRGVDAREVCKLFGHNFLGCGSYDLVI